MGEFTLTLANQMKEVLPGGVFDNPPDVLREQVQGTSTTNALSERCFGMSDALMRTRPNATTLNIESTVLFKQNNTHDWISNMSNEDLQLYTEFAKKSANQAKADYKDRLLEIKKDMQAKIVNRQMAEQQKVLKKAEIKSKIVDEIAKIGGEWKTCEQAQIEYDKLATLSAKRSGLITQLKFHMVVLGSKAKKTFFQQVCNGSANTPSMMLENLMKVIAYKGESTTKVPLKETSAPTEEEIQHRLREVKEEIHIKLKKIRARSDKSTKPKLTKKTAIMDPESLVGKEVLHTFVDETNQDTKVSYYGTVTRITGKPNGINTTFEIIYKSEDRNLDPDENKDSDFEEDDPDTFEYELLQDYLSGDLKILEA